MSEPERGDVLEAIHVADRALGESLRRNEDDCPACHGAVMCCAAARGVLRGTVDEVTRLRDALSVIAEYDPDEVRAAGVTPTDVRDIARNALLPTREEAEG